MVASFTQRVAELLVLRDGLGELALRLEQPLLQGMYTTRGVGEATAQARHLRLEALHLGSPLGVVVI